MQVQVQGRIRLGDQSQAGWQEIPTNQEAGDVLPPAACDWLLTTEEEEDDLPPCLLLVLLVMLWCRKTVEMGTRFRK